MDGVGLSFVFVRISHNSILSGWVELIGIGYLVWIQGVSHSGGLTCVFAEEIAKRKREWVSVARGSGTGVA
jgi:hypothetical protein